MKICYLIPRANAQEFGEQWRGNFCCCRHCVSCSVEKLNLFTDLPEEMGSLNILNIKYIIQEKPQTNPSIMILFLWIQVLMHWQMGLFLSHWNFPSVPGKVTLEVFTVLESRLWCHRTNELSTNLSVECKLQVLARLGHPTVAVFPFVSGRKDPTGSLLLCVCKYQLSVTVLCLIFHCEIYFGARKAVLLKTVHN